MAHAYGRRRKKVQSRFYIVSTVALLLMSAFVYTALGARIDAKEDQIRELQDAKIAAENTNIEFQRKMDFAANDPEYIERMARKDFNLAKEGETLYVEYDPE